MPLQDQKEYLEFTQQVSQLINSGSKNRKLQQQLAESPCDYILDLIYDESKATDIRKMACMILKLKISNIQKCKSQNIDPNQILGKLQTLYMINSSNNQELLRLQNAIEILLEKIFQTHFDDLKKTQLFQKICDQLPNEPLCKQLKHLQFLRMLAKSMYYLTVNNQVLIGQMVVYMGEVLDLLNQKIRNQIMQNSKCNQFKSDIYEILIKSISIMRQIKDIVQINNEEEQNVVTEYMQNSKQLRNHLLSILKMQDLQNIKVQNKNQPQIIKIWTTIPRLNKLKSQALNLWYEVWQYFAEPDLFQLLLATILTVSKDDIVDDVQNIITYCLMMIERSCTHKQYAQIFFKMTQNLIVKLFELISINQSQFSLIQKDPDYFIQINDDFCKQQQLQTMKTRAGSLIANLTLAIDGYLTFVTQFSLLALRQLQFRQEKSQNQAKLWKSFSSSWPRSQEQLIQTSILILSSISDQISKRNDLMTAVYSHLKTMIPYFSQQFPLSKQPLFILRYMQLYSFFSFPTCLDHFIRQYSKEVVYQKQLLKSFQTLMRYYDRKNLEMEAYVKQIGNSIMLLGDYLTPLLEQQIMNNNRIIKNFKENVLEKLVVWFLSSYQKEEVLRINKISTLIIRLLQDNMKHQMVQDMNLKPFSLVILEKYFQEIYKLLQTKIQHPCEQAIIQIAISHVQYLYDLQQIDHKTAQKFYNIGKIVTQRNKFSLNNCLILFNSLICPDIPLNRKRDYMKFKYSKLNYQISIQILNLILNWLTNIAQGNLDTKIHLQEKQQSSITRQEDLWEIFQLVQICIFQVEVQKYSQNQNLQKVTESYELVCKNIIDIALLMVDNCRSLTLKTKIISVILQIVQLEPQKIQSHGFLSALKFPNSVQFPAYECRKYSYCMMKIMKNYQSYFDSNLRIQILKIIIDLVYFLQNEKENINKYNQKVYINGDSVSLNALQKRNKIYSAFDFRIEFDVHEQFRKIIQAYPNKQQLVFLNQEFSYQGKIKDLVDKIIVNQKPRKKLTVKRNV